MVFSDWPQFHIYILQLEEEGLVTRTFRRLDPQRQQAVLAAILDEAAEVGPAALSIKRVAERAGVSVGSLYQYFASRDGMLDFAVELCVRFTTTVFTEFTPYMSAMPLREALVAYLVGGIEWSKTQASFVRFFARAAYHGDPELGGRLVRPVADVMRQMVGEILSKAAGRGELRPDVDLDAATRVVHALTIAVGDSMLLPYLNTYFQVAEDPQLVEKTVSAMVDLIWQGIGNVEGGL